jgi:hypothetical protein
MDGELLRKLATVLIQWGTGFFLCGIVTLVIGFIILSYLDMKTIKTISKFINN